MRILVIGQGGREHAIVRALHHSPSRPEVHVAPGNPGMALEAICHEVSPSDSSKIIELCRELEIELVVIGPEAPLVDGLADRLRDRGFLVFGPSAAAARLEGSKVFAKEFMNAAGIPTAKSFVVRSVSETLRHAESFRPPFVFKADGLAAGKGVFICKDQQELSEAAHLVFEKKVLGAAGDSALLEEFQSGYELSYFILTNGQDARSLPLAQDYKRIYDGDQGPNTGGMGTVAPMLIDEKIEREIREKVVAPTLRQLQTQKLNYRGVIFIGLMMTPQGPQVLEYNIRFGDPETQVLLPLLDGDWSEVFASVARGNLPELKWQQQAAACVVLAASGYPEDVQKGDAITGLDRVAQVRPEGAYILHAGTRRDERGQWLVAGGRVLNAVGLASSVDEALKRAYGIAGLVQWPGLRMRKDIGRNRPGLD